MNIEAMPKCPQCGAQLPSDAPDGLCPKCVMALNLKTETVFTGDSPAAQPPLPPEQIAPHFPQLEILECLGRGGMGVVYKARQKTLNRLVALKLLAPERVGDAKFAGRFTHEAQALAALNHPNIVTIYDFGQAGGFYFLLMEFVDGVNLRQLLRARKFTPEEALAIVPPLCDALQFAHERGIVHRDIKPENLLLDKTGRVKVADFGIAKMLGADNGGKGSESAAPENATQHAVGTPGYSAPEQKSNPQRVDSRADIYSLGVVFYEMLTGELPGKKIEAPSKKVQIDVRLDEVVMRALEKTPELRWQTAADLRTQVETITQSPHSEIPPSGPVTSAFLNGMRWRILIWGLALAAAGASMNFAFGLFGVSVFVVSGALALFFANELKMLIFACRLILIDGIVMASAAVWFAFNTESLKIQWLVVIVAGCLLGIGYCVSRWFKLDELNSEAQIPPPDMAAWLSLMDAGNYAQSWEAGSRSFRWAVTKGDWMEALEKVRRPLGKIISRKLVSTKYSALGYRCEAKFDSSFDGLKSTAETVVFTRQWNGEWKPAGYLIGHLARQSQSLRRLKKFFFFAVPAAILFTLIVRAYFLQPFYVAGGGVEPEIPIGSRILVWKFHPHLAPGDIIAHWHDYQVWASRVVSADASGVVINRNGQPDETIPSATVLGKVVSVYWRASNGNGTTTDFHIGQSYFPENDWIEITRVVRSENRLMVKGHYHLVSHDQATLALYLTTTTNSPYLTDTRQTTNISKGSGDFELVHAHLVPGLPHVSMRADGRPFADIYFGNKDEAQEESKLELVPSAYPGDWILEPNSATLDRVPPMFLLRPSTLSAGWTAFDMMGKDRYVARGKTLKELIGRVWSQKNSALKIIFADELPGDKFDFIVAGQSRWPDELEAEINRRFGLTEQIENHGGTQVVVVKKAAAPDAAQTVSFGPVLERVLPFDDKGLTDCLDLDLGKIISPLPPGTTITATSTTIPINSGTLPGGVSFSRDEKVLLAFDLITKFVARENWGLLPPEQINSQVEQFHFTPNARLAATDTVRENELPKTFIFKTAKGSMGILQITGFTENPHGVKLRYKLVQTH
jgi:predicted Ser/Thr protein kinase